MIELKTYLEYLEMHREKVRDIWIYTVRPILKNELEDDLISKIDILIANHDLDKSKGKIFEIYDKHYSHPEEYPKSNLEYRKAWNQHQKMNPHHWQYWVLMEDIENPKMMALPMELEYVIEMLCDWESASTLHGTSASKWYEDQRDNMILHPETIELIERYLPYLD